MAHPKQLTHIRWSVLLAIPILWCAAARLGWLDFLENTLLDWRFKYRGEISAPVKVVYVDIDPESTTDLGNQPWDRSYYAEVCDALIRVGKVKAVGIDFVFSERGKFDLADQNRMVEGNRRLAEYLYAQPPVVLAAGYASSEDRDINGNAIVRVLPRVEHPTSNPEYPEVPEFARGPTHWTPPYVGLIDTINGGTRWVPLFAQPDDLTFYHMAVQLARLYWDLPQNSVSIFPDRLEFHRGTQLVRAVPLTHRQDVEVNWFSHWSSPSKNWRASFRDVLLYARNLNSGTAQQQKDAREFFEQFAGGVVLIGPADPLLQDIAPTPLDSKPVPRVGIHGNLLKTIVSGIYLQRLSFFWQVALIFVFTALVAGLAIGEGRAGGWGRVIAGILILAYVAAAFWLFARFHWVLPLSTPIGAAFTTSFAGVIWQLVREEKQKGRIKSMFGTYVSPELVNRMVESGEDPKLGGAEVQITAYFSDIQDFSTFAETLTPPQLVEAMNEYLTACTDLITDNGGTLDKYIGDAVVAMFGAPVALPDHAYRACVASQRVQLQLEELRKRWSLDGQAWTSSLGSMRTRIGLNSGAAVVGNIGSHTRFNYTMMGDSVNLAARLESAAKTYGVRTLVSEQTRQACEQHGKECVFRFIDRIVVKGRSQPVSIFEVVGLRSELNDSAHDCIGEFERGLTAYMKQDWEAAAAAFTKSVRLENANLSSELNPSWVFLQRCAFLRQNPPEANWDGVWVMRNK